MKYVIYLDVIWVQNTILDMILLSLLTRCRKGAVKEIWRIAIGGIAGGIFSTAFYGIPLLQKNQILYNLLSCLGMIWIAIPHEGNYKKQIREICIESCMLHGVLFLIAGLWHWLERLGGDGVYSFWNVLWITCMVSVVWINVYKHLKRIQPQKCHVRLFYADKVIEVDALVDTGNSLCDPVTGTPVSIIEKVALEDILSEKVGKKEMCIIPYHSIGKRGILYGIKIAKMEIVKEGETILCENAIVAIYRGTLNTVRGCQMILHPAVLQK